MSFIPMHDNILIRADGQETTTPGGILLPDTAQKDSKFATVVSAQDEYVDTTSGMECEIDLLPGDRIMFDPYSAREVTINGEDLLLIRYKNILGKMGE